MVIRIALYVGAESTVSSSNFPTETLIFDRHIFKQADPEDYIEACIQRTIGSEGRGLVVM
jgi:hypothetical protein